MNFARKAIDRMLNAIAPTQQSLDDLDTVSDSMSYDQVAALVDPLFRNEMITHNYWRIAGRVYDVMGPENLVWPSFGSWASEQAGLYMRLGSLRITRLVSFGAGARVTGLLGRGNQLIFGDIALPFERFVTLLESTSDADLRAMTLAADYPANLGVTLALDPRRLEESQDGEHWMVMAFGQYLLGYLEADDDARAERIFLANCCVGLQEQSRVDVMLDTLLDAPEANRLFYVFTTPLRLSIWVASPFARLAWRIAKPSLGGSATEIERHWLNHQRIVDTALVKSRASHVLGTHILDLELGDEFVDLSDDLRDKTFASGLERLELGDAQFQALADEVLALDRTPDSTEDTAAVDWSDLADRMNTIIDLFRTHQDEQRLAKHPLADN